MTLDTGRNLRSTACAAAAWILLFLPLAIQAQLDETWTVTVGGQSARVNPDGSFIIDNIPDNVGKRRAGETPIGLTPWRVRGVSLAGGNVRVAVSEIVHTPGEVFNMPVRYGPPPGLRSLRATLDRSLLTVNETTQLRATAVYSDTTLVDVTSGERFSFYESSNPRIADVDEDGLVQARAEGIAYIRVCNSGATATARIRVSSPDPLTTIVGFVTLLDGSPAAGARVRVSGSPDYVVTSSDGRFLLPGQASRILPLILDADGEFDSLPQVAKSDELDPVPAGFTDGGILVLRPDGATLLGFAVDAEDRVWETRGDSPWIYNTINTFDGVDAAESGPLHFNETNSIGTGFQGPAYLSFYWAASSADFFDSIYARLYLSVDGKVENQLSPPGRGGPGEWQSVTILIPDGYHRVEWRLAVADIHWQDGAPYYCDITQDRDYPFIATYSSSVRGFLDQVRYFPLQSPDQLPVIVAAPRSQLITLGDQTEFSVASSGFPAPTYQWRKKGINIDNATKSVFRLASTTTNDIGNYSVIVSNRSGAVVSSNALLRILPGPSLTQSLDSSGLTWQTGSNAPWRGQVRCTSDGITAAQSAGIGPCEESWLETAVFGPTTICFRWRISAQANTAIVGNSFGDVLKVMVDGIEIDSITGDTFWITNAVSILGGQHRIRWVYEKDATGSALLDSAFLDSVFVNSCPWRLSEAADGKQTVWEPHLQQWIAQRLLLISSGVGPWSAYFYGPSNGEKAVVSGEMGDNQVSRIQGSLDGPGTIVFRWKVSSETNADVLIFRANGVELGRISGEQDWTHVSFNLPPGPQSVLWTYEKNAALHSGQDRAWLGSVMYSASGEGSIPSLGDAVEAPHLTWRTGGQVPWFSQSQVGRIWNGMWADRDAAKSGAITNGQSSWLETTVNGPGFLSFYWWLLFDNSASSMEFSIDGTNLFVHSSGSVREWENYSLPVSPGSHVLRWTYRKQAGFFSEQGGFLDRVQFTSIPRETVPVAEALDAPELIWTTSTNSPWIGEDWQTHDNVDAAQSGFISANRESWLQTTVNGPGTLQFWWKTSGGVAEFYTNNALAFSYGIASDDSAWAHQTIQIAVGTQELRWRWPPHSLLAGKNTMWLDQVSFVPAADSEPFILLQPTNQIASEGQRVQFRVQASGIPLPSYHWLSNNVMMAGETNNTLQFEYVTQRQMGVYSVIVSNRVSVVRSVDVILTVRSISNAVNSANLDWTTGGSDGQGWIVQSNVTRDGVQALQRAPIGNSEQSWVEAVVSGPGTLSFYWKVSSEEFFDEVTFSVDGVELRSISGNVAFEQGEESVPILGSVHVLRWEYKKDALLSQGLDSAWLDQVNFTPGQPLTISDALNAPNLEWSTGGDRGQGWFPQTNVTRDGVLAIQSGHISHRETSWVEAKVVGPGTLRFYWQVDSEGLSDLLIFSINNSISLGGVSPISGSFFREWREENVVILSGPQVLRWQYTKDFSFTEGSDAGWLDEVTFTPPEDLAPVILVQPKSQVVSEGQRTSLFVSASGYPPPTYRWLSNGLTLRGVTNASLSLDYARPEHAAVYAVILSNRIDSVRSVSATLVVNSITNALNTPNWEWKTGGSRDTGWFVQTNVTFDGEQALQSGMIDTFENSWLDATVMGPGTLRFYWKMEAVFNDFSDGSLQFLVDGLIASGPITMDWGWGEQSHALTAGTHSLSWRFISRQYPSSFGNAGWLDRIAFTPGQ